jgi:hypothetical protein
LVGGPQAKTLAAITLFGGPQAKTLEVILARLFPGKRSGRAMYTMFRSGGDTDVADLAQYFHGGVFSDEMKL